MNILPFELNYELLYFLPIESILNICQVSQTFAVICNDDMFWMNKLNYDYPGYVKPLNVTWRHSYLELARGIIRSFPIYYKGNLITNV